jgi:hypothetical protein
LFRRGELRRLDEDGTRHVILKRAASAIDQVSPPASSGAMLFIGGTAGIAAHLLIPGLPEALAFTTMFAALPGSLIAAPSSLILLGVLTTQIGTLQAAPIAIAVLTAYLAVSGTGVLLARHEGKASPPPPRHDYATPIGGSLHNRRRDRTASCQAGSLGRSALATSQLLIRSKQKCAWPRAVPVGDLPMSRNRRSQVTRDVGPDRVVAAFAYGWRPCSRRCASSSRLFKRRRRS